MPAQFIFRFAGKKIAIAERVPNLQAAQLLSDFIDTAPAENLCSYKKESVRSVFERLAAQMASKMKDPSFQEKHQTLIWSDEEMELGGLVFAAMDLPWSDLLEEVNALLEQFRWCRTELHTDIFHSNQSNCPPQEQAALAETGSTKTIAQRLEEPSEALYYRAAMLYQKLLELFSDYPAFQKLFDLYFKDLAFEFYNEAILKMGKPRLSPEEWDIAIENGFAAAWSGEVRWCNTLVQCGEAFGQYLKICPQLAPQMEEYLNHSDEGMCAVAYTFLEMLAVQLSNLAELQPAFTELVEYTLLEADSPDCTKDASRLYGDAQLIQLEGARQIDDLIQQVRLRLLGRLSLPEESPTARKHPDISSRAYNSTENIAAAVVIELVHMCGQHLTARRCERCQMLFVPFSAAAKYCDRTSPNGGKCTCKKAASDEAVAAKRTNQPALIIYDLVLKRINSRLDRMLALNKNQREELKTDWRKEVKPIVEEACAHGEDFDADEFEKKLEDTYNELRPRLLKKWAQAKKK